VAIVKIRKGSVVVAVIKVNPHMDITSLIASDRVGEGDVVLLEEGIYFQSVNVMKDNIRIVAQGPGVIFDGRSILLSAFVLSGVSGVLLEGIKMRYYRASGILVQAASGNRLINNTINHMMAAGIEIVGSSNNLVWRNSVCNCFEGIRLTLGSQSNWLIENTVKECASHAFETVFSSESNNAFIANTTIGNRGEGFNIFGSNNLVLNNLSDNVLGILVQSGNGSMAIGNRLTSAKLAALAIIALYDNFFAAQNKIVGNHREGMNLATQYSILLGNKIAYNGDTGFSLFTTSAIGNLVMDNKLVCNIPDNIDDRGIDNHIIDNKEKPCEPCQAPSDVCDNFPDQD